MSDAPRTTLPDDGEPVDRRTDEAPEPRHAPDRADETTAEHDPVAADHRPPAAAAGATSRPAHDAGRPAGADETTAEHDPVAPHDASDAGHVEAGDAPPRLAGRRVLVIEDETPVANFLAEYFATEGCHVAVACDGHEGLELFHSERPDLVICDLLLPKRNGFQLAEEFAQEEPDLPVVVMSGIYRNEKYRDELHHARMFLTKPFGIEGLQPVVDLLLEVAPARSDRREAGARSRARHAREPWVPTDVLPLPRVLQLLWREKRTGLLTHRLGDLRTVFMLREGEIHFVRCNDPELRLGRVLRQLGQVTEEQLERAEEELAARTEPTRLGEVLVRQGAVARSDLRRAVQLQLRKMISGAFSMSGGETLFRAEADASGEEIVIDTDTRAVIVAGCAAYRGDAEALLGHLPDGDCRVELRVDPEDPSLKLPAAERRLLSAIREPTRLSEVQAMAQLMGLRSRQLVFGMLCAEVIAVVEEEAEWETHRPVSVGRARSLDPSTLLVAEALALESRHATGTLTLRTEDATAWVSLEDGRLRAAGSDNARDRIGARLQSSGLITPEQLDMALEVKEKCPRKPLGRILVEMGSLDAPQLLHAVRAQVLAIATEVLQATDWVEATFEEGRLPDHEPVDLGLSTGDVVLGVLRKLPAARLERLAGALSQGRPQLALDRLVDERFTFTDTEQSVRSALSTDTEGILRSLTTSDESDADVLRVLVAALLVTPSVETALAR